jgi:hypothetical protein
VQEELLSIDIMVPVGFLRIISPQLANLMMEWSWQKIKNKNDCYFPLLPVWACNVGQFRKDTGREKRSKKEFVEQF